MRKAKRLGLRVLLLSLERLLVCVDGLLVLGLQLVRAGAGVPGIPQQRRVVRLLPLGFVDHGRRFTSRRIMRPGC